MSDHQPKQLQLWSGLSGIKLPVPKYKFPPGYAHMSRLSYYATFFNSIEINDSFYKIPQAKTVARWAASVPDDFKFTFKLFREITHAKDLDFDNKNIKSFFAAIDAVGAKKGCVLLQFPPGLTTASFSQLSSLLLQVQTENHDRRWNVAVEFRNAAWYSDKVLSLLDDHQCALVLHDKPTSATPSLANEVAFSYVRFHGPTGNYKGSYANEFLREYADLVSESLSDGKTVYIYFNNTAGEAFGNLITFQTYMAQ